MDRSRRLLDRLFGPVDDRGFAVRYWTGLSEGPADAPFTLVLNGPGALRSMFLPPTERSLGSAYVYGQCDVEGDIEAAVRTVEPVMRELWSPRALARLARELRALPSEGTAGGGDGGAGARGAPSRKGRRHSRDRDASSVRYHYDLGNDFYALWLDPYMQYSCGYFQREDESLEEAQEAKLDLLCRKLGLERGQRLLDIGCGWGGLVRFAAERFGVRATGITLSEPQAEFARRRAREAGVAERCRIRVLDYRDLPADERFDAIVSVGMVEHVGHRNLPEFFRQAFAHLRPGGRFLDQGIVTLESTAPWLRRLRERISHRWTSFIEEHVFPDGELVTTGERVRPAEAAGFEVRDVTSLREHYATTLRHWVRRLEARRQEAVDLVGEPTYRVWRVYMAGSAHAFSSGRIGL
ncbi:MAG TPA: cyclopropane-fatty-acyl-phospholipid synthase family protein, partial [Gemmatimonadota bacterium]|nr:cyclopropane-fatty-acyl-phospholipid synthase family protein [Gemmatimonadota bacterium]